MCRWRQVYNVYTRCGHGESQPAVEIKCESTHCKFSPYHPADCVPPTCTRIRKCNQYHLHPEQYTLNINGYCSACLNGSSRRY